MRSRVLRSNRIFDIEFVDKRITTHVTCVSSTTIVSEDDGDGGGVEGFIGSGSGEASMGFGGVGGGVGGGGGVSAGKRSGST